MPPKTPSIYLPAHNTEFQDASTIAESKLRTTQCPVHSDKKRIAEPFESQFKAKYGAELYEEIFQTFLKFDAQLNKMNGKIEWDSVSFDSKKVFPLVTQLPLFKVMCEIDKKLKDSHKCDEGLKDFFYFCAQRNKDSGFVLLLYTAHEIPPDLHHSHIRYFDSPQEFLSFVTQERDSLNPLPSAKKVTSPATDHSEANLSDTKLIDDTTTIISASTAFTASKPVAAQCPVHSDKKRIAEPFESQFKAKYGAE